MELNGYVPTFEVFSKSSSSNINISKANHHRSLQNKNTEVNKYESKKSDRRYYSIDWIIDQSRQQHAKLCIDIVLKQYVCTAEANRMYRMQKIRYKKKKSSLRIIQAILIAQFLPRSPPQEILCRLPCPYVLLPLPLLDSDVPLVTRDGRVPSAN